MLSSGFPSMRCKFYLFGSQGGSSPHWRRKNLPVPAWLLSLLKFALKIRKKELLSSILSSLSLDPGTELPVLVHSKSFLLQGPHLFFTGSKSNLHWSINRHRKFSSKLRQKSTEISKAANASGFKRVDTHHRALEHSPPSGPCTHAPHACIHARTHARAR